MSSTFGILAFPAAHSRSPEMYLAAFQQLKITASFERYAIAPPELNTFFDQNFRTARKIDGLAVSIPHKEAVIPLLDMIESAAQKIGAVNTVYWQEDKLCGANTDAIGFSQALREHFEVEGQKVLVLGAGGAARAVIYALLQDRADQIIIVNRSVEKARELAREFGVQWKTLEDLRPEEYELVINTTPLGMTGAHEEESPLPADFWRAHLTAFDIVYTPRKTKFLREAEAAGAQIISGEKMFLYQGMAQFEILTEQKAPREAMKKAITNEE